MNVKLNFHPVSERPAKSGRYLCASFCGLTFLFYSREHDYWNGTDTDGDGVPLMISAWAEIPSDVEEKLQELPCEY